MAGSLPRSRADGAQHEDGMTLEELRNQIDALDRQLVELLSERARAAQMIGHLKAATSLPVYEPAREKVIYANVRAANKGPLPDIELTHIYERIIDVMRALQRNELASERNALAARAGPRHWRRGARDREQAMIVAMQEKATEEQIDAVIDAMVEAGVDVHRTTGAIQTILAGVGPTASLDLSKFELLPGVLHVHRISSPYKLAGRALSPGRHGGGVRQRREEWAASGCVVMAGPCSIENREQMFETAARVKAAGGSFLRGGAFKPRSSPYAFQGLGIPGLEMMREAAEAHGLLIVSEVMEISQIEPMLPYVDCFQVGARNMQNFNLLRELGQVRKPVLLKRGIAATIEELLLSSEYILSGGNYDVILCERGIRTYETATRNTMDISAIPVVKKLSHLPIVADPSHGTGRRDMVAPMARAAVAAGADAILVEVHPNADKAASDAAQTLYLDQFEKLMGEAAVIATAVGRSLLRKGPEKGPHDRAHRHSGHGPAGHIGGPGVARGGFSRHDHRLESQPGAGAELRCNMGALDSDCGRPHRRRARESQVVLLAVPIYATLDFMEKLAGVLGSEHLVTDVGSTKAQISEAAGASLQHSGARGVSARPPHGGQGTRRRVPGRRKSVSRRGVAVH